jgi:hypothetical protein
LLCPGIRNDTPPCRWFQSVNGFELVECSSLTGTRQRGLGDAGGANAFDTVGDHATKCSGSGGRGGNGGAGAGGGILLRAPLVTVSGTINNTGGGGVKANGGTVKVYSTCGGQNVRGSITTGRLVKEGILMRP